MLLHIHKFESENVEGLTACNLGVGVGDTIKIEFKEMSRVFVCIRTCVGWMRFRSNVQP